jgi:hypothetical protein
LGQRIRTSSTARSHPGGREIIASALAPRIKARQALVDELQAIDAAEAADWPKREKAWAKALERFEAAQLAFRKARQECDAAIAARHDPGRAYSARRQGLEYELRRTSDNAAIDAFNSHMIDELEAALKAYAFDQSVQRNEVTREMTRRVDSNQVSIAARRKAIMAAMETAAALRLEPDQSTVPARLAELAAALPPIDSMTRPIAPPAK